MDDFAMLAKTWWTTYYINVFFDERNLNNYITKHSSLRKKKPGSTNYQHSSVISKQIVRSTQPNKPDKSSLQIRERIQTAAPRQNHNEQSLPTDTTKGR